MLRWSLWPVWGTTTNPQSAVVVVVGVGVDVDKSASSRRECARKREVEGKTRQYINSMNSLRRAAPKMETILS